MRSVLVLAAIMTQLFLSNPGVAQTESYDDCKSSCASDREERDADCPSPYDSSSGGQDRDKCLKSSKEAYNSCIKSCPLPQSLQPEAPPSSMGY